MTTLEKRRQIERWAENVADCADGIDELKLNEIPPPRLGAETIPSERIETSRLSNYPSKSYPTTTVKAVPNPRLSPPRKEPHIVRVVVHPSSSEGSTRDRVASGPKRSRSARSPRRYVINTSGSSRSRRAYADSIDSSIRRRRSPPRSVRSRRSPSPARSSPRYHVIRRRIKIPPQPEPDVRSRNYSDERPRYYDEERYRRPETPIKPVRPRPKSMDARGMYYPRARSPEIKRTVIRCPSPDRMYYTVRNYRDEPPRRNISVRSRRADPYADGPRDDAAKRLSQLYDVEKLRSDRAREMYLDDGYDSRRRRRSFVYSPYDDDYYDDRRLDR